MIIIQDFSRRDQDRSEAFQTFARQRAAGTVVVPPLLLHDEDRRLYVRRTLREDHQFRIHNRPEGAQAKFDKLAGSPFAFFRGTALLYYRDYAGTDAHLPTVFTIGDIHPENFGVMPNADGVPFFGVNDFDEAWFAPFSYDIKRGAVGFWIVAKENGIKKKKRRRVVRAWVKGYLDGLVEFAQDDREKWHQWRLDNSPEMIQELLESALESRKSFLEDLIDLDKERFKPSDELVPRSKLRDSFQDIIGTYVQENELDTETRQDGFFTVKDVALKKGSGTASLGLDRYWVLLEGPTSETERDIILELKQARRSALSGLVGNDREEEADEAAVIVRAHQIHLAGGDPYYGRAEVEGKPFLVRERSPFKDDIDVDDLDAEDLQTYARICGQTLAQTHARSDEDTGIMEGNAEERILSSILPDVFVDDVVRFAEHAAKRIYQDHKFFKADHALGVFQFIRSGEE